MLRVATHLASDDSFAWGASERKPDVCAKFLSSPKRQCLHCSFRLIRAFGDKGIAYLEGLSEMANQRAKEIATRDGGSSLRNHAQRLFNLVPFTNAEFGLSNRTSHFVSLS